MRTNVIAALASWLCRLLLLFLYFLAIRALPSHEKNAEMILLQVFLGGIIFLRFRTQKSLAFIPDEMLVAMPYLWSVSVLWHFSALGGYFHLAVFSIFAVSLLQISNGQYGFKGGLRGNDLLLAIYCSLVFTLTMAIFVRNMLPVFSLEMFRSSVLGIFGYLAGIPISLSAFFQLLPDRADYEKTVS